MDLNRERGDIGMRMLCGLGFAGMMLACAGLEGGAFGCIEALVIGLVSGAVMYFGFVNSDLCA